MSTNPEGNPQSTQDVIAALHLKLHHVEIQRDSAMAILKADMKQIAAGVLYEEVGSLKAENARLKAEVERLTKAALQVYQELDEFGQVSAKSVHELRDAAKGVQP
jgi:cell division protein FtsB